MLGSVGIGDLGSFAKGGARIGKAAWPYRVLHHCAFESGDARASPLFFRPELVDPSAASRIGPEHGTSTHFDGRRA